MLYMGFGCGGAYAVGVEWVEGLDQGLERWSGVMSVYSPII